MVTVKICCIASIAEAELAVRHGAAALGLVGRMPSGPGPIADERIAEIAAWAPPAVATFLLTCETEPDAIIHHVRRCGTSTVQLVDAVTSRAYEALRKAAPQVKIVQVIHVSGPESVDAARACAPHVDALLLDSGRPAATVKELGGTGRVHDWSVSRRIVDTVARPVFLAGGLNARNVAEAYRRVRPFGLDLCTGVRTDGRLDAARLAEFFGALSAGAPGP
ncbi:MAG: phosphoribosylanthranilate isomerase [Rhodospirillales bacterium]|nr:MAG: phosphoribosylanthranilate isomerase [Rhodospirillales bacterium]